LAVGMDDTMVRARIRPAIVVSFKDAVPDVPTVPIVPGYGRTSTAYRLSRPT
jgi:hypothetical protein